MALASLDRTKANDEMMETSYKLMRPCSWKKVPQKNVCM